MIEIRLLEGPNIHFPEAAVEVALDLDQYQGATGLPEQMVLALADQAGVHLKAKTSRPNAEVLLLAFTWQHRGKANAIADELIGLLEDRQGDWEDELASAAARVRKADPGDGPEAIDPPIPVVAVTGTNGKTTVTRLLAHIGRTAGKRVAWCDTDGIFLDGEVIDEGDYSGPEGARGAVTAPGADLAVLEVARGGLLRRGIGVTRLDVAVVTNVSADHLGEYHVTDLDRLADVKTSILTALRPDGYAVINAEDSRVFLRRGRAPSRVFAFSADPTSAELDEITAESGRVATVEKGWLVVGDGEDLTRVVEVAEVPVTLAGLSRVNIANALAAMAAAFSLGLTAGQVAEGLRTFRSDTDQNPGRMNLWELENTLIIVDYAHNAESLRALLEVLDGLSDGGNETWLLIGTAGDRTDEILEDFAEVGARGADHLGITEKERYLRGRSAENMVEILRRGAKRGGKTQVPVYPTELAGLQAFLDEAGDSDVVAVCAHVQRREIFDWLGEQGAVAIDLARLRTLVR